MNQPYFMAAVPMSVEAQPAGTGQTPSGLNFETNRESALAASEEQRRARHEEAWKNSGFGFVLACSDLLLDEAVNRTAVDFIASCGMSETMGTTTLTMPDGPYDKLVETNGHRLFEQDRAGQQRNGLELHRPAQPGAAEKLLGGGDVAA